MNKNDLQEIMQIHNSLVRAENSEMDISAYRYDPTQDIENTLTDFLKARLKKLEADSMFEIAIKNNILSRLPEMDANTLIRLLDTAQKNNNQGIATVLSPFISQQGETTILDRKQKSFEALNNVEKQLFDKADKNVLQGFNELKLLLTTIISKKENSDQNSQSS